MRGFARAQLFLMTQAGDFSSFRRIVRPRQTLDMKRRGKLDVDLKRGVGGGGGGGGKKAHRERERERGELVFPAGRGE